MDHVGDLNKCIKGLLFHQWSTWSQVHTPFDELPEDGFLYIRECLISGCNVFERAKDLAPAGDTAFHVSKFATGYERG